MGYLLSFWVPIISLIISFILAVINFILVKINKNTFKLLYANPIPEIKKISATPTTENGCGGFSSISSMEVEIYNPSSFGNHVKISFRQKKKPLAIIDKHFRDKVPVFESKYYALPPFEHCTITINLHYDAIKNYIGQNLILVITDIKNNISTLNFVFSNYPPAFLKP